MNNNSNISNNNSSSNAHSSNQIQQSQLSQQNNLANAYSMLNNPYLNGAMLNNGKKITESTLQYKSWPPTNIFRFFIS